MADKRARIVFVTLAVMIVGIGLGIGIYYLVRPPPDNKNGSTLVSPDPDTAPPPSESYMGVYWDAAVVTNGPPCSIIGRDILMKNGSAIEAAIAALFCEGLACLQSMGIGGGFLMTIYSKSTGTARHLNARERAPGAATQNMFEGNSEAALRGGLAVAVPGELRGYRAAFDEYKSGNLAWSELIQPSIDLAIEGILVTPYLAGVLKEKEEDILESPTMIEILIDPATNHTWVEGDLLKRPQLAKTLQVIAYEDPDALYTGKLVDDFVADIQDLGGIITKQDMIDYQVQWSDPVMAEMEDGMKMYSSPPPGSGAIVALVLNILKGFVPAGDEVTTHQRIAESFKYGFGKRTEFGDPLFVDVTGLIANMTSPDYAAEIRSQIYDDRTFQDPAHYGAVTVAPEDHGTAHISVVAPNGDAVSVTSTINFYFGAMVSSTSTGIILNDEMDDFANPNITNGFGIPPSPANYIEPGKRPVSSMCPSIFVDKMGEVQLVTGAAGGTKITTATALVAIHNLIFNHTVKEAVDARRFHHQLFPMDLQYEYGMPYPLVTGLTAIGHTMTRYNGSSSVTAIAREGNMLTANADFRRGGTTAGY